MASPMVQVNVRVPPEMHTEILIEAARDNTTVTAVVTKALAEHFNREGKK